MTTAFAPAAFQNNAFQIDIAIGGGPIEGATGLGAVLGIVDVAKFEREENERFRRAKEWQDDLRRTIERAFNPEPPVVEYDPEGVAEMMAMPDYLGMAVDDVKQALKKRKDDNDTMAILLMAV